MMKSMNEKTFPTYTGEISLIRWDEDKDDYVDLLTLEAFGETNVEVMRKLVHLTPVVKQLAPSRGLGLLPGHYITVTYPTFAIGPDSHHTSGSAMKSADRIIGQVGFTVQLEVNHARRAAFGVDTRSFDGFADRTDAEWVTDLDALLDAYEAEKQAAVADGRWSAYAKERGRAQRRHVTLRERRQLVKDALRYPLDTAC
jgi:hypothetical protein